MRGDHVDSEVPNACRANTKASFSFVMTDDTNSLQTEGAETPTTELVDV